MYVFFCRASHRIGPRFVCVRYYGSFRYMVRQAIRATTAAPTFFAPLMINGALYSDGALLCNNPSAVAFHEAKVPPQT